MASLAAVQLRVRLRHIAGAPKADKAPRAEETSKAAEAPKVEEVSAAKKQRTHLS